MSDPQSYERTQRLDVPQDRPAPSQPISYTEEYSEEYSDRGVEQTVIDPAGPASGGGPVVDPRDDQEGPRTWSTTSMVFTGIIALLLGVILALLLLPEEDPTIALDDAASQQALAEATTQSAELADGVRALQAENEQLRADLEAARAEADAANARIAGDDAAAAQAATDRQAAMDQREAALDDREAALAEREAQVVQREDQAALDGAAGDPQAADGETDGITLPDLEGIDLPVDLPQIDQEQARGVIERLIDRLQGLFGG